MSSTLTQTLIEIRCFTCATTFYAKATKRGIPRIPRGWKELGGKLFCRKCKVNHYALRAIALPVARCDWDVAMPALRAGWSQSRRMANWLLTQFYVSDPISWTEITTKIPPWKTPYLYNEARLLFPYVSPATTTAIINAVQSKYSSSRWDLWRGATSLPDYRSLPLPITKQSWESGGLLFREETRSWVFVARIGDQRHEFVLRSGAQFYQQHRVLAQIVTGEVEGGEAAIYQQGEHLMVKFAVWLPRKSRADSEKVIKARTAADCFLIAVDGSSESVWRLNDDNVLRWIIGAQKQQQRLREDLKAEKRAPRHMREGITERMSFTRDQRKRQMDSFMHERAMHLVKWCVRRQASTLIWDDTYRSYLPSFSWYVFAQRLEQKCEMQGIQFVRAFEGKELEAQAAKEA